MNEATVRGLGVSASFVPLGPSEFAFAKPPDKMKFLDLNNTYILGYIQRKERRT